MNSSVAVQVCNQLHGSNVTANIHMPSTPMLPLVGTNLLMDSIDKHYVHSDQGAYMLAAIFVHDDTPTNWKHGHIPLHNNFGSLCFRNPSLLCFVQNHFQAQSTPRTTFLQEGGDDEDMSSMGTTTLGEWHRDPRDQHGFPNRDGGPKLIRFESPRWRPKSSLSSSRSPGAAHTKNDTQAAYGVHFGRSIYGW